MRDNRRDGREPAASDATGSAVADSPAFRAALTVAVPGAEPTAVEPLGRGNRKRTFLVWFGAREPVVVQLSDDCGDTDADGRGCPLRAEALVLRTLGERTGVPVPAVLADGVVSGTGYLVTERVDGDDLHGVFVGLDHGTQRRLARTFGRRLAAVHDTFGFEGYGPVQATDGGLAAQAEDWPAWLRSYGLDAVGRLPPAFDDLRADLRALFDGPAVDPHMSVSLYPWDFRPGNALLDGETLTAVLDWERPLAAPPALSVTKAEYLVADWYVDDPAPLRAAFREGYRAVRPWPETGPVHRVAAVAATAVDTAGVVTRPSMPELDRDRAVAFHRRALEGALDRAG